MSHERADDEIVPQGDSRDASRRRRFQKLDQRRAATNVTTYHSLSLGVGSESGETWFEGSLTRWRELCGAEHWRQAVKEVMPFVGPLPKIVHDRQAVFDALSTKLIPEAVLSLEAIMDVMSALARDLQGRILF